MLSRSEKLGLEHRGCGNRLLDASLPATPRKSRAINAPRSKRAVVASPSNASSWIDCRTRALGASEPHPVFGRDGLELLRKRIPEHMHENTGRLKA